MRQIKLFAIPDRKTARFLTAKASIRQDAYARLLGGDALKRSRIQRIKDHMSPRTRRGAAFHPNGLYRPMDSTSLTRLTATAAAQALKDGTLTSTALVSALLARIAERQQAVDAWAFIDSARALKEAQEADAARRAGRATGALAGLPVGVKDVIDTADFPTEYGTPVFKGNFPACDAAVVGELKRAGAIILGKTVTTELAFFGPGKTRNPHNPAHTPGGSSSGSAAAVADFQVPLALGTQTAGSVIRPASFCGAVGFKPTFGSISRTGILPQSAPLDTVGTYGRCVDDVALLADALSAYDPRDPDMPSTPKVPLRDGLDRPLDRAPRFAFILSPGGATAEPAAVEAYLKFAHSFGARAEVVITELSSEFDGALRLHQIVQYTEIARNYGPIADKNPDVMSQKLREAIAEGRRFTAADFAAARAERDPLYDALRPILVNYDAIMTPASAGPAPAGLGSTGSPMFNALWTYLGMPAISLPLLTVGGLPLGVQLVGARGDDARLLRVAKWLFPGAVT